MLRAGGPEAKNAGTRNVRGWALRIIPAVVALGASVWWISGTELLATLRASRPLPLVAGMVLQILAAVFLGFRWRAALASVHATPLPTIRAATVLSVRAQAAVVLAPGGLGTDVLRGYESGYGQEMWRRLTKVAVLERVVGAACLGLLCALAVLPLLSLVWSVTLAAILAVFLVAAYIIAPSLKIGGTPLNVRAVLNWTLLNQILALAGLTAALAATGIDASLPVLVSIAAVAAFAAMLPLSINGYGLRELALAALAPRIALDAKMLAAAGLVASTILLASLLAAALAARFIPLGARGGFEVPEVSL